MILDLRKTNRVIQILLICLIFSAPTVRIFNTYALENNNVDLLINIILILLGAFFVLQNNIKLVKPLLFEIIVFFVVGFNYMLFPENRGYILATFNGYWQYITLAFLCAYIAEYDVIKKAFNFSAVIILVFDILLLLTPNYYRFFTDYAYGGVGLVFSYSLLFPAIVFLRIARKDGKKIFIVPSITAIALLLIYGGNRTALLCYIIAFIYTYFIEGCLMNKKKFIIIFLVSLFAIILLENLEGIVLALSGFLGELGLSSRVFDFILSGRFFSSSGRNEIREVLVNHLFSIDGVFGFGVCGDRVLTSTHEYAHNIFLEILIQFGWILGLMFCALLIWLFLRAYKRHTEYNEFIIILIFSKVLALMVSATFWNEIYFWCMIAICLRNVNAIKNTGEESGNIECYKY